MPLPLSNVEVRPVADQDQQQQRLPLDNTAMASGNPDAPAYDPNLKDKIINRLLGTNGEERYQLWPEKLIRDALSAPHDIMKANPYKEGTEENLQFENDRQAGMIPAALNMSALAGTGGLGGVGAEAGTSLGASPFLRPALKYEGKIYKAPMGGQHMDAIPKDLQAEFTRQAMSGEDISNFDFGFMNHKGHFINREEAMKYAVDNGLIDPHDARYGALTSTLMADNQSGLAAKLANMSRSELERLPIDDLDRAAFGHAEGDKVTLNPKDINIKYKDDMANPEDKFKKGGMDWVNSVDRSSPVEVSIDQSGKFNLEDGHHRYFAADKLNQPLQAEVTKVTGKPIEKLLNSDLHKKLSGVQ
jgi:hypothetical protein